MSKARLVLEREWWRIVAIELPNQHGVLETEYIIEQTEPKAKDRLGVQQWKELKDTSALGDWIKATRSLLDEALKTAGEQPNNEHQRRIPKQVPEVVGSARGRD